MGSTAAGRDLDTPGHEAYDAAHGATGSLGYRTSFEIVNVGLAVHNLETLEPADINQHYLDIPGISRQLVIDTSPLYVTVDIVGYDVERILRGVRVAHEKDGATLM